MDSKTLLAGLFVVCLATFSFAQEITGDIRGIVRDPSGAVVSGATVDVVNTDRNAVIRSLTTDANGAYVAPLLPLGHYKLAVTASGFKQYNATDIALNVNDRRASTSLSLLAPTPRPSMSLRPRRRSIWKPPPPPA